MRRRGGSLSYTLRSGSSSTSYRSWERVIGAARSGAGETGAVVRIVDEDSGPRWDISSAGKVGLVP